MGKHDKGEVIILGGMSKGKYKRDVILEEGLTKKKKRKARKKEELEQEKV